MTDQEQFQQEIESIKQRNKRVETDKAWEVSWARKILIAIVTYITIVIFSYMADLPNPFLTAIIPTVAFVLSTLTLPLLKKIWIKNKYK